MNDSAGIERRLAAALARIAAGLDGLATAAGAQGTAPPGEAEELRDLLETERAANAQLTERVRAIKEKQETMIAALEKKVARLSEQAEQAEAELQRQSRVNAQLAEVNRALVDAAAAGTTEPHLINRAMMTELEALRAARSAELAEMNDILAELKPLLGEVA